MDLAGLLLFSSALFIAAASPGPGIAAIVARVLGRGPKEAVAFSIGVALGDVVWLSFAILGLAALAQDETEEWLLPDDDLASLYVDLIAASNVEFTTALFPKDGRYLVPLKNAVRQAAGIDAEPGQVVEAGLRVGRE